MMKKSLLFLFAAALLPLAMGAQALNANKATGLLQRYTYTAPRTMESVQKDQVRADLAENQRILGHYDTDEVMTGGYLGLTGFPGVIPTAIEITPEELAMFQGGKIVAFRVGLASSTPVTRVFVAPSTEAGFGEFTEWSCNYNAEGWNVIPIDPPYEINLDSNTGLLVGFDYQQTNKNYPISAVEVGDIYPTYMYINYNGSPGWYDLGLGDYGNLSLQCIVESDSYPDYALRVSNLMGQNFVNAGEDMGFTFKVKNTGLLAVEPNALTLDVLIDGEKVTEITNSEQIGSTAVEFSGSVPTIGLETGEHVLTVATATLSGEAVEDPQSADFTFKIIAGSFPRQKHLVEQLTSTYCTYCPLGNSVLSLLKNQRDDVIWVGVHGNMNGTDPFRNAQSDSILTYLTGGNVSYPSAAFDRTVGWEDDNTIANGIGYYEQYHQQVADEMSSFLDYIGGATPAFATINAECVVTEATEGNSAKVTISGDVTPDFNVMMGEDAKLTVYIVEDSLVARQLNGGTWVSNYVHNGVFRTALGSVFGVPLNITGETYSNTFEFEIPAEWNVEKLHVVAFISRPLKNGVLTGNYADMFVDNADIFEFTESNGIEELLIDENAVPVEYYDIMGRQYDSLQNGVNIVKMSDGSVKKVLLK